MEHMYTIYVGEKSKLCYFIDIFIFRDLYLLIVSGNYKFIIPWSYVYAKSIYIFLTWDDPKFKLKYIVKWTKLQDDKIRIMSENS